MVARGADSELVGLPPRLERRVLDLDLERRLVHLAEPGLGEELREMPLARTGELRLVHDVLVERACGVPEDADRPTPAGVVPDARSHDAVLARDTCHLAEPADRVTHEVDDELRERRVERRVGEREALRGRLLHADARMTLARRLDERLRRVDGRDGLRSDPAHELTGQGAGPTADVEHVLRRADAGVIRKEGRERDGIAAHEAVIRARGDREAHVRNSRGPSLRARRYGNPHRHARARVVEWAP